MPRRRSAVAQLSTLGISAHIMGWSLSRGSRFEFSGAQTLVCADGNNVAWTCPCGGPVLFVYQSGRRGSRSSTPTSCSKCGTEYFLDPSFDTLPEPPLGDSVAPAEVIQIVKRC